MDSNLSLVDREREKYEKVYAADLYRGGPGASLAPEMLDVCNPSPGDSLADYGCGGGHALIKFQDAGLDVIGTDIVETLVPDYRHYIPFVAAPLWDLPIGFPVTDWGFSAHVLEHLPPEKVDESLSEIARHTAKGFFVQVFLLPDIMGQHLNMTLHLTIEPWEWWAEKLSNHFTVSHVSQNMKVDGSCVKETRCLCTPRHPATKTTIPPMLQPKSAETVCIVGHGPSNNGSGRGPSIDAHENVIRFTWNRGQPPEDYGRRMTHLVTSLRNHGDVINDGRYPEKATWLFSRPGALPYETMQALCLRLKKYKPCMCREVWPWHYRYRDLGATGYIDPRQGEPGLIPSFSQGTGAIIMACARINPRRINLAGFDNVWAGKNDGYTDWTSIVRGAAPRTSGHDLRVERMLINELMEYYNVEIASL
jgi:hypothetical protein